MATYYVGNLPEKICIGEMAENIATTVVFDFAEWVDRHGDGVIQMLFQRPKDENPYPIVPTVEGTEATWTPTSTDTERMGFGKAQLIYTTQNDVVEKSPVFWVAIGDSLEGADDPPEPYENWLDTLTDLAAETQLNAGSAAQSAEDAENEANFLRNASAIAETLPVGSNPEVNLEDGVFTFGMPLPADGNDGYSPTIGVSDITGGHRVTVTDKNGTRTFDVMDGIDGEDGDDGVSPTITVTSITGGHRVTITDATGTQTFDVMDGQNPSDLDAGDVAYDESETYPADTVGAEISGVKSVVNSKAAEPSGAKAAGKVYGLDSSLNPVWLTQSGGGGDDVAPVIVDSASGDIVSFPDGAEDKPVKAMTVNIVPVQTGAGEPTPSNIRPITGWTGTEIWNDPVYGGNINWNQMFNGLTTSTADGITTEYDSEADEIVITNNSRSTNYSTGSTRSAMVPDELLTMGHKYFLNMTPRITGVVFYVGSTAYTAPAIYTRNAAQTLYLRVTKDYDFVTAHPINSVVRLKANVIDLTAMFGAGNEPATAAEFEALFPNGYYPYNSGTVTCVSAVNGKPYGHLPVSWQTDAGTAYRGTLTINEDGSADMVLDCKSVNVTGNEGWTWQATGSGTAVYTTSGFTDAKKTGNNTLYGWCSMAERLETAAINHLARAYSGGGLQLNGALTYWGLSEATAAAVVAQLQAWNAAGTPLQLVYAINTPLTYHFDSVGQLTTFLGQNNIWSDIGSMSVQYRADTKLWIQNNAKVSVLAPTGNTHTLEPCPVTYAFGEKSELSVIVMADTQYHFSFSCPSGTPTVLTMTGITGRAGDTLTAGKSYEVDIWAGIALVKEIEVTAVT